MNYRVREHLFQIQLRNLNTVSFLGNISSEGQFKLSKADDDTTVYICKICEKTFKKRGAFTQHYKQVHLKLRPKLRSCHLCDVKVPGYLRAFHMDETHGLPAPTCEACGKKFPYPWQVLQHQKIFHMGERKYKCLDCNMVFGKARALKLHGRKHLPEKMFKCEFCNKSFTWRNNLIIHLKIHLDIREHICSACGEAFVQPSTLKYHVTKKHPDMI